MKTDFFILLIQQILQKTLRHLNKTPFSMGSSTKPINLNSKKNLLYFNSVI